MAALNTCKGSTTCNGCRSAFTAPWDWGGFFTWQDLSHTGGLLTWEGLLHSEGFVTVDGLTQTGYVVCSAWQLQKPLQAVHAQPVQ